MVAEIISIGDELLIGQVVNTNASWISAELNKSGVRVVRVTMIADDAAEIKNALSEAEKRANLILITGGLGPTKDDITKKTLAEYFDSGFVFHEPTFRQIEKMFAARNYPLTEINRKQAEIPEKCIPLANTNGTAPGMWFEKDDKIIISMPGVPFEMQGLISDEVLPRLSKHLKDKIFVHKTIMTTGIGESALAEKIESIEASLPGHIKLAYLPQPGMVRLRLSTSGNDKKALQEEVDHYTGLIFEKVPRRIFGYDEISIEEVIGNLLREKGKTVSTAESCTGGYIAHLITGVPGSSDYFIGSVVSYSNEVKIHELGVKPASLYKHGAVSREVVEQMAKGVRNRLSTDYSLATTGIAGPDGGTPDKPVGTVWIAVASASGVQSRKFSFGDHRGRNIRRTALAALDMLRLEIIE